MFTCLFSVLYIFQLEHRHLFPEPSISKSHFGCRNRRFQVFSVWTVRLRNHFNGIHKNSTAETSVVLYFTVWIFGDDRFGRGEWFGIAFLIHGCHPELVLLTRFQVSNIRFWFLQAVFRRYLAHSHPFSGGHVHFFHFVLGDRATTVVLRFLPFEFATLFGHVSHLQRPFRRARFAQHGELQRCLVLAGRVFSDQRVHASVFPNGASDGQCRLVVDVLDFHPVVVSHGLAL